MSDLFKHSDTYQIYISCKEGCYNIYIVIDPSMRRDSLSNDSGSILDSELSF